MDDEYYGPGSEEYERDMREEWQQESAEWEEAYSQYNLDKQAEQDMSEGQSALQEDVSGSSKENCYADYSGGRTPRMACDYDTGISLSGQSIQESAIIGGIFLLIVMGTIILVVIKNKRNRN